MEKQQERGARHRPVARDRAASTTHCSLRSTTAARWNPPTSELAKSRSACPGWAGDAAAPSATSTEGAAGGGLEGAQDATPLTTQKFTVSTHPKTSIGISNCRVCKL